MLLLAKTKRESTMYYDNGVYFSASFVTVAGEDGGLYRIPKKDMMQAMKKNKQLLLHAQDTIYAIGAHSTPNMDGTVDTQGYVPPPARRSPQCRSSEQVPCLVCPAASIITTANNYKDPAQPE